MFDRRIYIQRRESLKSQIVSGLILLLGNEESPMNYASNPYCFRQDSTFLYYFGLDDPGLAALIDNDNDQVMLFGYDYDLDDIIWMGPQKTLKEKGILIGVNQVFHYDKLKEKLEDARRKGRMIHYLPPYRQRHVTTLREFIGIDEENLKHHISVDLIKAVVAQRSIKSPEEIEEIKLAHATTHQMHTTAMKMAKAGLYEREIAGAIEGIALSAGGNIAFPVIMTIHGETLHNHFHGNKLKDGDMLLNDSGAETALGYASDITRTFPVSGKFTQRQKDIYQVVLNAQLKSIQLIQPGILYRDIHLAASKEITQGLKDLGLIKGDVDKAVSQGAHAVFFPHGLGHMLGLDVHDMENLGEDYIGYDQDVKRSDQFGLAYLRLAKKLKPGFVVTVEPGIYFIPALIDKWRDEKKFTDIINYSAIEKYKDFGGIRIEDNVLLTDEGCRVIGQPIPKQINDVEQMCLA